MKFQFNHLFNLTVLVIGVSVIIMFARREKEDLVTESEVIVSHHAFDQVVVEIPFETATFGMG